MKNQTNKILLAAFLLTSILYILDVLIWLEIISIRRPVPYHIFGPIALIFSAVPAFCFQMLLCRMFAGKWIRLIPMVCLLTFIIICAINFVFDSGWDSLGWLIVLLLCIAPTAGCGLAFIANHFGEKKNRKTEEP